MQPTSFNILSIEQFCFCFIEQNILSHFLKVLISGGIFLNKFFFFLYLLNWLLHCITPVEIRLFNPFSLCFHSPTGEPIYNFFKRCSYLLGLTQMFCVLFFVVFCNLPFQFFFQSVLDYILNFISSKLLISCLLKIYFKLH